MIGKKIHKINPGVKMMRNQILTAALLLSTTLSAHAADWYVLGAVSQSQVKLDKGALDNTLSINGASGINSDQSGTHGQWRLQLGYQFTPNLAVEGGYIDLGKANYDATFSGGNASAEWKSGGVDLALVGSLPLSNKFTMLGKLGAISTKTTTSWRSAGITGLPSGDESKSETKPFVGVGASYALMPKSDLRLEYEHFSDIGDAHLTGNADVNTVSLGMSYHFD